MGSGVENGVPTIERLETTDFIMVSRSCILAVKEEKCRTHRVTVRQTNSRQYDLFLLDPYHEAMFIPLIETIFIEKV